MSKKVSLYIVSGSKDIFSESANFFFTRLAGASEVSYPDSYEGTDAVQLVTDKATIYIPLAELVDFEKELIRLNTEKKKTEGEIERIEKKLSNEGFIAKAPAAVIEGEKAKLASYKETLDKINAAIEKIK
jgi:valyl-tRNA synthetase